MCEFIEDCEHIELAIRILYLLGREGPRTPKPYKYIRFIYNRVLLESPAVRAAAVTSLAKFGASCEDLCPSVMVLLEHCLLDNNDEVRDRALLYLEVLKQKQKALASAYILNRKSQRKREGEREIDNIFCLVLFRVQVFSCPCENLLYM